MRRIFKKDQDKKENYYNDFFYENDFISERECLINSYSKIMLDEKSRRFAIIHEGEIKLFNYEDLIDFEIQENGTSIVQSKVGSTLLGGVLLGGVGALAGANSRKRVEEVCNTLTLKLYFNQENINYISERINKYPVYKNSIEYQNLSDKVDEIVSILKYIKMKGQKEKTKNGENEKNNLYDLKELAELKEKGIITEEEFEDSKKKILSKI